MKFIVITVGLLSFMLSSCAPINTEFSCNKVAGDRCLTIEEVNAMTEHRQIPNQNYLHEKGHHMSQSASNQTIWLAPWVDERGVRHSYDVITAKINNNKQGQHHVG